MPNWEKIAPVVDMPCPLCQKRLCRLIVPTVWDAPDSAVYQCDACKLVFIYPIMTQEEEKAFYQAEFARYMSLRGAAGETVPEEHFQKNQVEAERRLSNLQPYLRKEMSVLEVGSSTGFMLSAIAPHVASVSGVEPNRLYADYARGRSIKVFGDLAEAGDKSYDLILAYYVLEHLRDPVDYLKRLCRMLNPNGTLALEVPNVDDALVKLYQIESFDRFYWQKAHYYYYSHETLEMVLKRAGFNSVAVIPEHRYDFSNHLYWMLKGEPGGKGKYSQIFDARMDRVYAECLKAKWLCDTIFGLARKTGLLAD